MTVKVRRFGSRLLAISLAAGMSFGLAGCAGAERTVTEGMRRVIAGPDDPDFMDDVQKEAKDESLFSADDVSHFACGLRDRMVKEGSVSVSLLTDVGYDKEIVKEIRCDSSDVDFSKAGQYTATYYVTVKAAKAAPYLMGKGVSVSEAAANTAANKESVTKVPVTVTVVSETDAKANADRNLMIYEDDGYLSSRSDGSVLLLPILEAESAKASGRETFCPYGISKLHEEEVRTNTKNSMSLQSSSFFDPNAAVSSSSAAGQPSEAEEEADD